MTELEWGTIRNFKPSSGTTVLSFGDPSKMNYEFMQIVDAWTDFIKCKPIVLYGTQGIHSVDSEHYYGLAVDVVVPDYKSKYPLFDLMLAAMRFPFMSIGVYPHWKYNNEQVGGLHLGGRKSPSMHQWMGVLKPGVNKQITQEYISLNGFNLKNYGVI